MAAPVPSPNPNGSTGKYAGGFTPAVPSSGSQVSSGNAAPSTGSTSTGKFAGGFGTAPTGKAKSKTPAKTAAPKANPVDTAANGAISAGVATLNAFMTPMYAVEDSIYNSIAAAKQNSKTPALSFVERMFGIDPKTLKQQDSSFVNATAWARGGEVKHTGGAIAKELGLINPNKDLGAVAQNTAVGTAFDIALDPFTYTPAAPVFTILKGITRGTKAAVIGANLARKGIVPIEKAAAKTSVREAVTAAKDTGKLIQPDAGIKPKNLLPAGEVSAGATAQEAFTRQLKKTNTMLVQLPKGVETTANDAIASGLTMGYRALRATMLSKEANNFLSKYAYQQVKVAKKAAQDYLYTGAEDIAPKVDQLTGEVIPPKPSEVTATIAAPKTYKKAKIAAPDTAPNITETVLSSVGTKDIKAAQESLKKIDMIAKKVVGVKVGGKSIAQEVSRIANNAALNDSILLKGMRPELQKSIKLAVDAKEYNPFSLINEFSSKAKAGDTTVAKFLNSWSQKKVTFGDGVSRTVSEFYRANRDTPFYKLPVDDQMAILDSLKSFTKEPKQVVGDQIKALTALIGKDGAQKVMDTGALDPRIKTNTSALQAVLGDIASKTVGEKVRYKNFEDLLAGLHARDQVSPTSLANIVKQIDPENAVIKRLETASEKPTYDLMHEILMGKGESTVADMRRRIALADTPTFLKSTGLAFSDAVAAWVDHRITTGEDITPTIFVATRKAASARLARMDKNEIADATTFLNESFAIRFGQKVDVQAVDTSVENISTFGDKALRDSEKPFAEGNFAILPDQTNQHFQQTLESKLAGIVSWRTGKKQAKNATENISEQKMHEFILQFYGAADVLLSTTGTRMFIQSSVKAGPKHVVLLHLGDIANQFAKTPEGFDVIRRALFIAEDGTTKFDSLDWVSVLETTRQVMFNRENGLAHNLDALYQRAGIKADVKKLSPTYRAQLAKNAKDFVDHLINVAAPELERIHQTHAMAATEDYLKHSMDISESIVKELFNAWKTNLSKGIVTDARRFELVQDMFNRFVYSADLMNQENGQIAEAVMRAASMLLIKNGKLQALGDQELADVFKLMPDIRDPEHADLMELINTYQRHIDPALSAPLGRERLPFPTDAAKGKAQNALTGAMDAIIQHRKNAVKISNPAELKAWQRTLDSLQGKLDKARLVAWRNWIPTKHWQASTNEWVPSELYDHAADIEWAKQQPPRLVGDVITRGKGLADTKPVKPETIPLTPAEKAAAKKASNAKNMQRSKDLAKANVQDAAEHALSVADDIEALGLDELEQAERLQQESMVTSIRANVLKPLKYSSKYAKNPKNPVKNQEVVGLGQRLAERLSAGGGRKDLLPAQQRAEAAFRTASADISQSLHMIRDKYYGLLKADEFKHAFSAVLSRTELDSSASDIVHEMHGELTTVLDAMMADMKTAGLTQDILRSAFKKFNLNKEMGFLLKDGDTEDAVKNMFENLPFSKRPDDVADGTREALKWEQRAKAFEESGQDPFLVFMKTAIAVQYAKMENGLVHDLVARFSNEAHNLSVERAIRQDYLRPSSIDGEGLSRLLPPDVAFPPMIAKQFASLDREFTRLYKEGKIDKFTNFGMELLGVVKFFQTVVNPRHHVTNFVGDTSAEVVAGTRNPIHWQLGLDLAREYWSEAFKIEWRKNGLDKQLTRTMRHFSTPEELLREAPKYTKNGDKVIPVIINGKSVDYNLATFKDMLVRAGAMVGNIFNDEIAGAYESILADTAATGATRALNKKVFLKIKSGMQKGMKPFGDFASAYGNIPRAAGAVRIATERTWKSEQEMLDAIMEHVTVYHPTIQSLSATERRWGRMAASYYTWLRVAHVALIDMAANHTASMLLPAKIASNVRQANGIDQQAPGSPYAVDSLMPQSMKNSPYGPLFESNGNLIGGKFSFLPMDVMDNWNFYYDPALNAEQQAALNITQAGKFIGGQINLVVKDPIQELFGYDFTFDRPIYDRTPSGIADRLFQQDFGPSQALKGIGVYTPKGKTLTQEQRDMALRKWITGDKEFNASDPALITLGIKERNARLQTIIKNINEANK